MGAAVPTSVWGACRFCGTAVPPGVTACGLCGADRPVPAGALPHAPLPVRRRIAVTNALRAALVIGVAAALAYTMLDLALTGPPTVQDPLTTTGTYAVPPGSVAFLSGEVTGGDYIVGNFTSVRPYEANITLSVYNYSAWTDRIENGTGSPVWSTPSEGNGRIVFTAEYTDTYMFVLTNPYPPATDLNITVYVATEYESNVGDDGFG